MFVSVIMPISRTMLSRLCMWPCSALVIGLSGISTTKTTRYYWVAVFKTNRQSFHPPRLNDWPFLLKTLLPNYIHLLSLSSSSKLKYSPMAFVMPQLRIADYDTRNKFVHTTFLVPVICLYLSFEIVHVYVHNDDDVDVYQ